MKKIKFKQLRNVYPFGVMKEGDWIDLRAAEEVKMCAGEYRAIPLGVAMELPRGYEAIMAPRSSTFKNYGILMPNSIGVIDESFKGEKDEWHCLAYATRNTVIHEGDRICQFRIIKHQPKVCLHLVKHLKSRSRGGIGSTGRT